MTKTRNPLRVVFDQVFVGSGFSRKGDSWYRRADEVVEVVNLQKSQYGKRYYVNYAIWLPALGGATFPKEEMCHVRMRLDSLVSNTEYLTRLLDLEAQFSGTERETGLTSLLVNELLPFAAGCRSLAGIGERLREGKLSRAMVSSVAKKMLNDQRH